MSHYLSCVFQCAIIAILRLTLLAGVMMPRHAGVIVGVVIGTNVEAVGIDGIVALRRYLHHRLFTKDSIQVTATRDKLSNSMNFTRKITVTNRVKL